MISLIKFLIEFCIIPWNVFWIVLILAFLFRYKNKKTTKNLLIVGLVWLLLTGTKWIPDLLVYGLEKQYPTFQPDSTYARMPVMVLGGGSIFDRDVASQDRLSPNSLARLTEGIRLYHALDRPLLVFSGYSSVNGVTQAAITREAAISLGIPEEKISILEQPSTTEEEALAYKKQFGHRHPELILVTSDIHMPRAMYLFEKAGLQPIAAPADVILRKRTGHTSFWWSSHKNNFDKFSAAMHEYIGLIWAGIR